MPVKDQPTLFDTDAPTGAYGRPVDPKPSPPPHSGKATSREAARAAEPKAGTWRAKVLDYVRSRGADGATRDETATALAMSGNTLRPRWRELTDAGLIRDTGRTRLNSNNLRTEVFVAAPAEPS